MTDGHSILGVPVLFALHFADARFKKNAAFCVQLRGISFRGEQLVELKQVLKAQRHSQTTDKCAVKLENLSALKWKKYRFSCGVFVCHCNLNFNCNYRRSAILRETIGKTSEAYISSLTLVRKRQSSK